MEARQQHQGQGQLKAEEIGRYVHSPVHYAVARGDYAGLRRILATLPRLPRAGEVTTEEEAVLAEERADIVSAAIDRRDVPGRETPLHVAVRLGDAVAVEMLMAAGADWSLQNEKGWSALQEAVCAREDAIAMTMTRHYQPLAWAKWCRRLPRIVATAGRMRDFYMEITFHFESSVIPFVGRIAPSDTYRIWKRGSNLRADMTLAGFDGFRIQRSDQSFLFLGDGHECQHGRLPPGSLLVLTHKDREVSNALEGAGMKPSEAEVAHEVAMMAQTNMYRPGIDVTQAELVPHLNWRRQDRTEMVGPWKAKIYDMLHVSVSVKSRRVPGAMTDEELFAAENEGYADMMLLSQHEKEQLDSALEHSEDDAGGRGGGDVNEDKKGGSWFGWNSKSHQKTAAPNSRAECNGGAGATEEDENDEDSSRILKKFSRLAPESSQRDVRKGKDKAGKSSSSSSKKDAAKKKRSSGVGEETKQESEYKKGLRPVLWLTSDFPLQTEEFVPLLDILANKVKAVRRLRELLTTKLPPGTFPVKVAIPIVPTIRVVITFTKFEELQPLEEFSTPLSSPAHFQDGKGRDGENYRSSSSWMSWMRGSHSRTSSEATNLEDHLRDEVDPFYIPSDYTWVDLNEKKRRMKAKKTKNKKGKKHSSRNAEGPVSDIEE
uniref:TSA: Wollemia nobilis Ref_Wollemi_Transcript_18659_2411 transcribed RNA sequence n=1 Tax=Wollemia nobilis TaxID=56998 RepID=A0A0C9S5R4_9CONI